MTPLELTDPAASTESLAALLDKDDATNRLIAKHPKVGAALLEKLSHSSDRTTRALVTANPDTPPSIYLRLGAQFPSEFLANPMLDLLFLENPALLQDLSGSAASRPTGLSPGLPQNCGRWRIVPAGCRLLCLGLVVVVADCLGRRSSRCWSRGLTSALL